MSKTKKPRFQMELHEGDHAIVWVKYKWEGEWYKIKYELVAKDMGNLTVNDLRPSY